MSTSGGEGRDFKALTIRKCSGVNSTKSFGSNDVSVRGHEFKIAFICVNKVDSSSNVMCVSQLI